MAQPGTQAPPPPPPYAQPPSPNYGPPQGQTGYPGQPYNAPPPPAQPKSRKMLYVGIVVVVVVVILVIAVLASLASPGSSGDPVRVAAVNITSSDNACGANGHSFPGFNTTTNGLEQYTLTVKNTNFVNPCTIQTVSTTTSGFSLSGANTPVSIPAGGTEAVSFTIHPPSGTYTGVLTLDIE